MQKGQNDYFQSPTFGPISFRQAIEKVLNFIEKTPEAKFKIVVGTDSEIERDGSDFVTALVVHQIGRGGIYFWQRSLVSKKFVLRDRIYQEAVFSLLLAQKIVDTFAVLKFEKYNLEIHVDIGTGGETREMISEVVGMIRGTGFAVKTKPEAYGASSVADRHT